MDDAKRQQLEAMGYTICDDAADWLNGPTMDAPPAHTPASEYGRAPWTYECVGDSDGETVGYDHLIFDADGNELATAPNEAVAKLMAAGPSLLAILVTAVNKWNEGEDEKPTLRAMARAAEPLLQQLAEPQVYWRAPAPDAVYTLEADLKRAVEDRAKLLAEVKRLRQLARLVTAGQVLKASDETISASGLNPWCMNEGTADASDRIDLWRTDAVLAEVEGYQ